MTKLTFTRGQPIALRATTKIHIGEHGIDIPMDEIVEFDGQTLSFGGDDYSAPKLKAAVASGWLVPEEDTDTVYRPKPAGVKVKPALNRHQDQEDIKFSMDTAFDEERVVSTRKTAKLGVRDGRNVIPDNEGVPVVPSFRTPTKQAPKVSDTSAADREIQRLDNTAFKRAVVIESDDDLTQLLDPDAPSVLKPKPGLAGEGDRPHLTPAEKAAQAGKAKKASRVETTREQRLASLNKSGGRLPVEDPTPEVGKVKKSAAVSAPVEDGEDDEIFQQKMASIRMLLPDFEWDLSRQWKVRVKDAVENYGSDPVYLRAILAVEQPTVAKKIREALS